MMLAPEPAPTCEDVTQAEKLKGEYPDYLSDPVGLERFRQAVLHNSGHDMAAVNHNSLGRLIDTIERLRFERDEARRLARPDAGDEVERVAILFLAEWCDSHGDPQLWWNELRPDRQLAARQAARAAVAATPERVTQALASCEGAQQNATDGAEQDLEDQLWCAIMEAQGPDSNARDYARAVMSIVSDRLAIAAMREGVDRGMVEVPREVVAFLKGEGPLGGQWFGDPKPAGERGNFWWRKHLPNLAALSRKGG